MALEPPFDFRMLVRSIVVCDEMEFLAGRRGVFKEPQELDPLLIGDSGPKRTGFLGEGENRSGVKANTIPGPTRTKIPAGTRMVFVPPRNCFRDGPE